MSITAMKQALDALEEIHPGNMTPMAEETWGKTITALRIAIEQAEKQEPVACIIDGDLYYHHEIDWEDLAYQGNGVELLYTTPPAAQQEPDGVGWLRKDGGYFAQSAAQQEAVLAEREACAKVVEASPSYDWHRFACEAAAAIRARGQE